MARGLGSAASARRANGKDREDGRELRGNGVAASMKVMGTRGRNGSEIVTGLAVAEEAEMIRGVGGGVEARER